MENKEKELQFNGWRDSSINNQVPIEGILEYLNILNQRLILIEDVITTKVDGEEKTLTQYWIEVQKREYQKAVAEYKKQMEAQKANETKASSDAQ